MNSLCQRTFPLREIYDHSHLYCFVDGSAPECRRTRVKKVIQGHESKATAAERLRKI
jgi:hypothetical protein